VQLIYVPFQNLQRKSTFCASFSVDVQFSYLKHQDIFAPKGGYDSSGHAMLEDRCNLYAPELPLELNYNSHYSYDTPSSNE
jgi:hypothetical protein